MDVYTKQFVTLLKDAMNFSQIDTQGKDAEIELIRRHYKRIQQFATIAKTFQDFMYRGYDISSILEFADFILDLRLEEFKKIAANLPFILDGIIPQNKAAYYSESDVLPPSWKATIATLSQNLPDKIDLTDSSLDDQIFGAATDLLNRYPKTSVLQNLDRWLTSCSAEYKDAMLLVSKLALSKMYVRQIEHPLHISLILAMYNEHNRMYPKSSDNPNGEDFVRRKIRQMDWLLKDSLFSYTMILVDDGCPQQSGRKAQKIIDIEGYKNIKVLYIDNGIKTQVEVLKGLKSACESQKGGAIQYGMWQALEDYSASDKLHAVVFTDADLSVSVSQIGLLLEKLNDKTMMVVASRYDAGSICRVPVGENGENQEIPEIGRQLNDLRGLIVSKLFPQIGGITDTQCGLKAFNSKLLRQILLKTKMRTAMFDIELLTLAASVDAAISVVPIYCQHSPAESNFGQFVR